MGVVSGSNEGLFLSGNHSDYERSQGSPVRSEIRPSSSLPIRPSSSLSIRPADTVEFPINITANGKRYIYIGHFMWRDMNKEDCYFKQTLPFLLSIVIDVQDGQTANDRRYVYHKEGNYWEDRYTNKRKDNEAEFLCSIKFDRLVRF